MIGQVMLQQIGLVALGGARGACLRYSIGTWISFETFPLATILVNVIGSFFLGMVALSLSQNLMSADLALFLGTGILGAFTTMSAFSVETVELLQSGNSSTAGLYIVLTFTLCPIFAWSGWIIGNRVFV
jgi:CrcB protein